MACAIGRQIVHTDAASHPGYQQQCPAPAFHEIVIAGKTGGAEEHKLCRVHFHDLYDRGLLRSVEA